MRFAILLLALTLVGCSQQVTVKNGQFDSIAGSVYGVGASSLNKSTTSTLSSCTTEKVKLYSLTETGLEGEFLAETSVDVKGEFSFSGLFSKGVVLARGSQESTKYLLRFICGSEVLNRFVTGPTDQNIDFGTTIIAWLGQTQNGSSVTSVDSKVWQDLYGQLSSATSVAGAYTLLISNPEAKKQIRDSLMVEPESLNEAAPMIRSIQAPTSLDEEVPTQLSALAHHWSPSYDFAYEWRLNGQLLSQSINYTYIPKANDQGSYTLQFFVGANNGSGGVDTSKPYMQKIYDVVVANSVLPEAPVMSRLSALETAGTAQSARLATGAVSGSTFQNCRSFSHLALVEESSLLVALPPTDPSAYTISCTTVSQQDLTYTSQGIEGPRALRLWARDAAGVISALPREVIFNYDITAPSISITSPTAGTSAQASLVVSGTCETGLSVALAGAGISSTSASCVSGLFSASVNFTAGQGAKGVTATQTDLAGNLASSTRSFEKDSVAPVLAFSSPTAGAEHASGLTITGTCEESLTVDISGTGIGATSAPCAGGVFSAPVTFSLGDGTKTILLSQTDLAGNTGTATRNFIKDSTAPVIAWTSPAAGAPSRTSVTLSGSCETGFTVQFTGLGIDATSASCVAGAFSAVAQFTAGDGLKTVIASQTDASANTANITRDFVKDSTAPAMELVEINDGDTSTSSVFNNVKVRASESRATAIHYRFALANTGTTSCQTEYADNNWSAAQLPGASVVIPFNFGASDGIKKICVWVKDDIGNISVIAPAMGTLSVDFDSIDFFIGNPPVITSMDVLNGVGGNTFTPGEPVHISWSLSDVEGLSDSPLSIFASVNGGAFTLVASNVGSLSGNPTTGSGTYTGYSAPSGVFRIRLVATDSNGNTSVPALSSVMNSPDWSVFMGSSERGIGGQATSLSMNKATFGVAASQFAMNPLNGDIYAISYEVGIYKLDAQTGATSIFLNHGSSNFVDNMTITNLTGNTGMMAINFDKAGRLYISNPEGQSSVTQSSVRIWQVDFANNRVKFYAGGGSAPLASLTMPSTTTNLFVSLGSFDVDDSGALYVFSDCDPTIFNPSAATHNLNHRLLKIAQNPDGTPGAISLVAGDCSLAGSAPVNGAIATATNLGLQEYRHIRHIAVNGDGSLIYISDASASPSTIKIATVAGVSNLYHTSIGSRGLVFDRQNGYLYAANGSVFRYTLPTNPAHAETGVVRVASNGTGNCNDDGVSASSSCINAYGSNGWAPLEMANDGSVLFTDNLFRIRYVDANNELRTIMGTRPFYGENLHRLMARGMFSGIHYKTSNNNLADYPKGLYFVDSSGGVFGYVDPVTQVVSVIAGNQQQLAGSFPANGSMVSRLSNLADKGNINFLGLTFNSDGLPRFMANARPVTLGPGKTISYLATGGTDWMFASDQANITSLSTSNRYSTGNLVSVGADSLFTLGVHREATPGTNPGMIGFFDFSTQKLRVLMKGNIGSNIQAAASDSALPSTVNTTALAGACRNMQCYIAYNTNDSKLYFSEGNQIRALASPTDPSAVTLESPANLAMGRQALNFIFSPDNNRVFYVSTDGKLYCKWIGVTAAPSNCLNSSLGPNSGFANLHTGNVVPNALTFIEDGKLLVSRGTEVYLYTYSP